MSYFHELYASSFFFQFFGFKIDGMGLNDRKFEMH